MNYQTRNPSHTRDHRGSLLPMTDAPVVITGRDMLHALGRAVIVAAALVMMVMAWGMFG